MNPNPSEQEQPKDYATRRVDPGETDIISEQATPEPEKKARTRKTPIPSAKPVVAAPAVTVPLADQPLPAPMPPAPPEAHKVSPPRNDRVWVAAIVAICVVVLACICACTIIAAVFLTNAPW